jgi:regulator of sigma E protease
MSWFLAFAGFAALIILHEFGHFAAAKAVGMKVTRFNLFFPPHIVSFRRGETDYGIGAIPLGGYVKIVGMNPQEEIPEEDVPRAYYNQPVWKRLVVIGAGPLMNIVLAFLILFVLFAAKGEATNDGSVGAVQTQSAAAGVLKAGDVLVSVDGVKGDSAKLRAQISRHTCADGVKTKNCVAATPATVVVKRDNVLKTLKISPRYDPTAVNDDGSKGRMLIGFTFGFTYDPLPVGQAASRSVTGMWEVTKATVSAITKIFYNSEARKNVSGIVGSYETTRQTIQQDDIVTALQILALISLSLAIVNLFPFLPLDGGHIFWALAEKVRGRPIPFRVMEQASYVGFILVIAVFFIGFTNDIDRLRGAGFGVK